MNFVYPTEGFPADFPSLKSSSGKGKGEVLGGFGGDVNKDRTQNQKQIKNIPIVFIHGNGSSALDKHFGWAHWYNFLKQVGYNDSEIWAVSYLGKKPKVQLLNPHTDNIEDIRQFIDAVRDYLGAKKVILIGHSLGCGLIRSYLRGLEANEVKFCQELERFNSVSTAVLISGGNYGLSTKFGWMGSEFDLNGKFIKELNNNDVTPYGASDLDQQSSPVSSWKQVTNKDNNTIRWIGIIAIDDFCDKLQKDTSRLEGAHLNKRYNTGSKWIRAHSEILKLKEVFDDVLPFLS